MDIHCRWWKQWKCCSQSCNLRKGLDPTYITLIEAPSMCPKLKSGHYIHINGWALYAQILQAPFLGNGHLHVSVVWCPTKLANQIRKTTLISGTFVMRKYTVLRVLYKTITCLITPNHVPRLSCVGRGKRAWYTLFVHAQFSQNFWKFGNFCKTCCITLTSVRHANFSHTKDACHWPRSVWMMMRQWWRYSALCLQELSTHLPIPAKHCHTWLTQFFSLKFYNRFEWSNADRYCQRNVAFDFKTTHMCPTGV